MISCDKITKVLYGLASVFKREASFGQCPVCEAGSVFVPVGPWYRESLKCVRCRSSARHRAVVSYLRSRFKDLAGLKVYELSPYGVASAWIARSCGEYTGSHFYPESSSQSRPFRNETVESLSFPDACFDLVISQDVFEHVGNPMQGFAEIARVLRKGGSHVFTIPWFENQPTSPRAVVENNGVKHLKPAEYHGDPVNERGSLVMTDFGTDLAELIHASAGMRTAMKSMSDERYGIKGDIRIFHSEKR